MGLAVEFGAAAFAFMAGAASFFSPCSVGLFPAYVGFFLGNRGAERAERTQGPLAALGHGILLGTAAAGGFFALFLALGGAVSLVGSSLLAGGTLRATSIAIGLAVAALGAGMFLGKVPRVSFRPRFSLTTGPAGLFAFGLAYGTASLGCTLPIFLAATLGGLATGGVAGLALAVAAYGAGMALLMVAVTAALAVSMEGAARWVRAAVPHIQRASSGVMVVGGLVLVYYYVVVWA